MLINQLLGQQSKNQHKINTTTCYHVINTPHLSDTMTSEPAPFADEDCKMQLNAPTKLIGEP